MELENKNVKIMEQNAECVGKIPFVNDNPKFYMASKSKVLGVIHSNNTISLFDINMKKLWNYRIPKYTPNDIHFSPCENFMAIVYKCEQNLEKTKNMYRIILVQDCHQVLYELIFYGDYQCGNWTKLFYYDPNMKGEHAHLKKSKKIPCEFEIIETIFKHSYENMSTILDFANIFPFNKTVSLIKSGNNQDNPNVFIMIVDNKAILYLNGIMKWIDIDLKKLGNLSIEIENVRNFVIDEEMKKVTFSIKDTNGIEYNYLLSRKQLVVTGCLNEEIDTLNCHIIKVGNLMITLNGILEEIKKINLTLESFLDYELFDFLRTVANSLPNGFISPFLELLMFGICSHDMLLFLKVVNNEGMIYNLQKDLIHLKEYTENLIKIEELLELFQINFELLKNYLLVVSKMLNLDEIKNFHELFEIISQQISDAIKDTLIIIKIQNEENIILGLEYFYSWIKQVIFRIVQTESEQTFFDIHEKTVRHEIGQHSDKLQFLINFVGKTIPYIFQFMMSQDSDMDSILNKKVNLDNLTTDFSNFIDTISKRIGNDLFNFCYLTQNSNYFSHNTLIQLDKNFLMNNYYNLIFATSNCQNYYIQSIHANQIQWNKNVICVQDIVNDYFVNHNFVVLKVDHTFDVQQKTIRYVFLVKSSNSLLYLIMFFDDSRHNISVNLNSNNNSIVENFVLKPHSIIYKIPVIYTCDIYNDISLMATPYQTLVYLPQLNCLYYFHYL